MEFPDSHFEKTLKLLNTFVKSKKWNDKWYIIIYLKSPFSLFKMGKDSQNFGSILKDTKYFINLKRKINW